jgi:hypothetical protein
LVAHEDAPDRLIRTTPRRRRPSTHGPRAVRAAIRRPGRKRPGAAGDAGRRDPPVVDVERPAKAEHGDLATNLA